MSSGRPPRPRWDVRTLAPATICRLCGFLLGTFTCFGGGELAAARETLPPDKLIVLVQAAGCDWAELAPRLDAAGRTMAHDHRTTRVTVDQPSDPDQNRDLTGKPSPLLAAIEVSASPSALRGLARQIHRDLGPACTRSAYLVRERRLLTTSRRWGLGEPSPLSKTLITLVRKQGVTRQVFQQEWGDTHAARSLAWRRAKSTEGHYVQNLVVGTVGRSVPPLDGIGETEGPFVTTVEEREARVKSAGHAATFQDMRRSSMLVAREIILKD